MAKTPLEKQLEKQMKQEKQLADKRRRDEQKRAREEDRLARKEATQKRAASIVNGQPFIDGFRVMDATSEEMLESLLKCERSEANRVNFQDDIFPQYTQMSISLELEKLTQYGMISGLLSWDNGGVLHLLPQALTYFEDKSCAMERQEKILKESNMPNIINYGNLVYGNISDSTLSVDNSIRLLENQIEENGGEDKEELKMLLAEVKELIENMKTSRSIPKQKRLFERVTAHASKHGWFYGAILQLLGTAAFTMLSA